MTNNPKCLGSLRKRTDGRLHVAILSKQTLLLISHIKWTKKKNMLHIIIIVCVKKDNYKKKIRLNQKTVAVHKNLSAYPKVILVFWSVVSQKSLTLRQQHNELPTTVVLLYGIIVIELTRNPFFFLHPKNYSHTN